MSDDLDAAEYFRRANRAAKREFGGVGGFPTLKVSMGPNGAVNCPVVVVPSPGAQWLDVPLKELQEPGAPSPLDDFGERMRAAARYASRKGFAGAFPTFYHAERDGRTVLGIVLLKSDVAAWDDVPAKDLGNPVHDSIESRCKAAQRYAQARGFAGGFPTFFHADKPGGREYGTTLIKKGKAKVVTATLWQLVR
ncbi:hypothetical protein ACI8AC_14010 [Geodermatophilus sp. SYSU D00758]